MGFDSRTRLEEHELAREVVEAAEQAHVMAGYSMEALSKLIVASRRFQRALRAGADPDPASLLLAFGGASALVTHLHQRFEAGAAALGELRFGALRGAPHAEEPREDASLASDDAAGRSDAPQRS